MSRLPVGSREPSGGIVEKFTGALEWEKAHNDSRRANDEGHGSIGHPACPELCRWYTRRPHRPSQGLDSRQRGEAYLEQRGVELRDTLTSLIKAVSRQRDDLTAAIEAGKQAYRKATGKAPAVELPATPAAAPEPEG